MSNATRQGKHNTNARAEATEQTDAGRQDRLIQVKNGQKAPQHQSVSRFEKFAATQAAGDGIEGDALKPGKTVDEKLAANMADRK